MEQATGFNDVGNSKAWAPHSKCKADERKLLFSLLSNSIEADKKKEIVTLLFERFTGLREIIHASKKSIYATTDFGPQVYAELNRLRDLATAMARTEIDDQPVFDQYDNVVSYCRTFLAGENLEQFHALFLNKSRQFVGDARIRSGTTDHVTVYPRELIEMGMAYRACGIILVHNHPSGIAEPSRADIAMTKALVQVGKILGMAILDHLIIGRHSTFSFRKHNLINKLSN